jgi:uncharacterized protein (TIGR02145 family)
MKKYFLTFGLLLTVGVATVVFNSCGKDDDDKKEKPSNNQNDPNNPNDPSNPTAIAVTGISLDTLSLTLAIGEKYSLTATVTPGDATDKTVTWASSDDAIAIVVNGMVTAQAAGEATITAQAGNQTAFCVVTVSDALASDQGVVINGVKWATRNVDAPGTFAAKPEDTGMIYQWNRKIGWLHANPMTNSNGDTGWDYDLPSGDSWEKANDPCPAGWRVPTLDELRKLFDTYNVSNEWAIVNGVTGRKLTDKTSGNSLFLPAAGTHYGNGYMDGAGVYGNYWSSTQSRDDCAHNLFFGSNFDSFTCLNRSGGLSVRAVAE